MKTNLSNIVRAGSACPLSTAILALAITLTFTACGKGGGDVKLLESITDDDGKLQQKFEYDEQNRLVKIYNYNKDGIFYTQTITYSSDDLITSERVFSSDNSKDTINFVRKGNIITGKWRGSAVDTTPYYLTLNKNGYIVKTRDENSFSSYQYKAGNLIYLLNNDGNYDDYSTYDNKKSPYSNINIPKWLLQYVLDNFAVSKNNVLIRASGDKNEESKFEHKYEYDSDGFPTREVAKEMSGNYTYMHRFTYRIGAKNASVKAAESLMPMAEEATEFDAKAQAEKAIAEEIAAAKVQAEAEQAAKEAANLAKLDADAKKALKEATEYIKAAKEKALKEGRTFTDERDGKTYMWVKIGTQTWMAENLNYNAKDSQCYGEGIGIIVDWKDTGERDGCCYIVAINKTLSKAEIQANCQTYGRLYLWDDTTACPSGWHLPNRDEWQTLVDFTGGEEVSAKKLKAKSGWNNNGNGTDEYGFAALPGGEYIARGTSEDDQAGAGYESIGNKGRWLSSTTESGTGELGDWFIIYTFSADSSNSGSVGYDYSVEQFSIRCVKD